MSDSAADISTDPEDEAGDEIDSEDEAAEETDPEIRSILASSDDESDEDESDEELLPPPEDIWYDSLDELQAAIQEHAIRHGYSITIKRTFTEREKKNFQCDRSYAGTGSTKRNRYRNNHTLDIATVCL